MGAVDEVPGAKPSLLAFDQKQALPRQHEEVLLRIFSVVERIRLGRAEDANAQADLVEASVVRLEGRIKAATVGLEPGDVARIDDKPALSGSPDAVLYLLKRSLGNHPISLIARRGPPASRRHNDGLSCRGMTARPAPG